MLPKRAPGRVTEQAALPFDVTQDIDPALVDEVLNAGDATLTQVDFEEITLVLPEMQKP